MKSHLFGIALMLSGAVSAEAVAQVPAEFFYDYRPASSTALGDALRGSGELVRSVGDAVRNGSVAAVNIEAAKSQYLKNSYDASKTFWDKKLLWAENSAYHRGRPLSSEQLRQIARDAAPGRLGVMQLSPATGAINWPAGLLRPEYDALRGRLELLFANRTVSNSGVGSSTEVAVARMTNWMQEHLKTQINEMTTNEYIAAKSFLRSLAYEARFMPGAEHVARR
jgi:hypothetical protein